jgi:hypothetical protein
MTAEIARAFADGFRCLAQMIEDYPDLADALVFQNLEGIHVSVSGLSAVETLAAFARAGKASGATVRKEYDSDWGTVRLEFNDRVGLSVFASRNEVCERVVTGTEVVKKVVPDPSVTVPLVEIEETVETVEWVCSPLLASRELPPRRYATWA